MNGIQIERVLDLIDSNIEITRSEVLRYLQANEDNVVKELLRTGSAEIPTTAGMIRIPREELEAEFSQCSR